MELRDSDRNGRYYAKQFWIFHHSFLYCIRFQSSYHETKNISRNLHPPSEAGLTPLSPAKPCSVTASWTP